MDAIVVNGLTKRFGDVTAVDGLSFTVPAGHVTGLLGPNGAGKTTTLLALLGLVHPDEGGGTFRGKLYRDLSSPARHVGAALDNNWFHAGRTARHHLRIMAAASNIDDGRVDEVLAQVDLTAASDRRVGGYSLGMRQRLALAQALLGDPAILVLDEPANGLDPEGVRWLRDFVRSFASEGRTVLVSSHMLAEVAQTVDHVVIISKGRLVRQGPLSEIVPGSPDGRRGLHIRTPEPEQARIALSSAGLVVRTNPDGTLVVAGATAEAVGHAISKAGLTVYEMSPVTESLEDAFFELTSSMRSTS